MDAMNFGLQSRGCDCGMPSEKAFEGLSLSEEALREVLAAHGDEERLREFERTGAIEFDGLTAAAMLCALKCCPGRTRTYKKILIQSQAGLPIPPQGNKLKNLLGFLHLYSTRM